MNCRHCGKILENEMIDLEMAPPSNSYIDINEANSPEVYYPLRVLVCDNCWLVQTQDFTCASELFSKNYAYFSSTSFTWLEHSKRFAKEISKNLGLNKESLVIEVACNDGYLLQYFKELGTPTLGIEPTLSTASAAKEKGIDVVVDFFGEKLAKELKQKGFEADLMIGNNVLAHVPNINDFLKGFHILLKDSGVVTFEFPHILNLINENQFDTIYHEHYSYLSLYSVIKTFETNGLNVFKVEELPTHGGSLRVYGQKQSSRREIEHSVKNILEKEVSSGIKDLKLYSSFSQKAETSRYEFLEFLINERKNGRKVAGYGAAAKGNTLLNYSKITKNLIPYIVDNNINKQGKLMPGSRIPIVNEEYLLADNPDTIIVFPWNLISEIIDNLKRKNWKGNVVCAIPSVKTWRLE